MSNFLTNLLGSLCQRAWIRPATPRPRRATLSVETLDERVLPSHGLGHDGGGGVDIVVFDIVDSVARGSGAETQSAIRSGGDGGGGDIVVFDIIECVAHGSGAETQSATRSGDGGIGGDVVVFDIVDSVAAGVSTTGSGTHGSGGGFGKVSMRDFHYVVKSSAAIDPFGLTGGAPGGHVKVEGHQGNDVVFAGLGQDDSAASIGTGSPNRLLFLADALPAIDELNTEDVTRSGTSVGGAGKVQMQDFHFVVI